MIKVYTKNMAKGLAIFLGVVVAIFGLILKPAIFYASIWILSDAFNLSLDAWQIVVLTVALLIFTEPQDSEEKVITVYAEKEK